MGMNDCPRPQNTHFVMISVFGLETPTPSIGELQKEASEMEQGQPVIIAYFERREDTVQTAYLLHYWKLV